MIEIGLVPRILLALALAQCVAFGAQAAQNSVAPAQSAAVEPTQFQGDVYILSGGFGVFSTGLGKLKSQLAENGVSASLAGYQTWRSIAQKITDHRRRYGRKPVIIIGHSLGADSAVLIANALKTKGIQVDLIVSYAATGRMTVPSNVRNVLNFYFKSGGWGYAFSGESDFKGTLNNQDMSGKPGIGHFNIDDNEVLRGQVVRSVLKYVRPEKSATTAQ